MFNTKTLFFSFFILCFTQLSGQINTSWIRGVSTNEPSLAIDPNNPAYQFIGGNVDLYFLSSDSGKSWNKHQLTSSMGVYGDPVVSISGNGRYYFAHLSKTSGKEFPAFFDRIVFQYSEDRGMNFNKGIGVGYNEGKMQDKPWFFVRETSANAKDDKIALVWTEFDEYKSKNKEDSSRIRFAYSKNGGKSFSDAVTISDRQGGCMDNDQTLEGATPVILSDGSVHVVWAGHEHLYYDCSLDGGKTWGKDQIIDEQKGGWDIEDMQGFLRTNGMPFMETGPKDELYLVWAEKSRYSYDVNFRCSRDKGKTWEPTVRLGFDKNELNNYDVLSSQPDCFLPHLTVDPVEGTIYVVYYDKTQTENYFTHVSVSWSDDGREFKHFRLTDTPFANAGKDVFFGDYNAIAASNGQVRAVWTSTYGGVVKLQTASFSKAFLKLQSDKNEEDSFFANIALLPDEKLALHILIRGFDAECRYHFHLIQRDKWVDGNLITCITEKVFNFDEIDFSEPFLLTIMILDKDRIPKSYQIPLLLTPKP